jgi:hypothetical protein
VTVKQRRVVIPDWTYDLLQDHTPKRKFWIPKGLGSGGTYGSTIWFLELCRANRFSPSSWVVAPTFAQVRDPLIPTFSEVLQTAYGYEIGRDFEIVRSGSPRIVFKRSGHEVFFKSANKPETLVAANISHLMMTEPGLIAKEAFEKSAVRIRCPKAKLHQAIYEGTPEGVGNFFEQEANFEGEYNLEKNYRKINLWTEDNLHTPGYKDEVTRIYGYDKAKLESYLYGRFVPLTRGNAYWAFSHSGNVKRDVKPSKYLPIAFCWDFQKAPVSWVAMQRQPVDDTIRRFVALSESTGTKNGLMDNCIEFAVQYDPQIYGQTEIHLYGGADGYHEKLDQDGCFFNTIKKHLRALGFKRIEIRADTNAPSIRDRQELTNSLLTYGLHVVSVNCPNLISSYQETENKPGTFTPKKHADATKDKTHYGDAATYYLYQEGKEIDLENPAIQNKIYGLVEQV